MSFIIWGALGMLALVLALTGTAGWHKLTKTKRRWKGREDLRPQAHKEYLAGIVPAQNEEKSRLPNVVVILMDDMGWGDVGASGNSLIKTPHLDALAASGAVMRSGFASSPVCTPSRFGLLTGRYPSRGLINGVFFPSIKAQKAEKFPTGYDDDGALQGKKTLPPPRKPMPEFVKTLIRNSMAVSGILEDEITLPEALQARGYRTGMFGKWHLGDKSPHLPNDKGFEYFYGAHYSNDMMPYHLWRNRQVVKDGVVDQSKLTEDLTREITGFMDSCGEEPFFVYYPSPWPHHPLNAGDDFKGKSKAGIYGDCIQEIDWSVGEIRKKLEEKGALENTIIIFSSDNGPWHQGSPGGQRGRKGNAFNGGVAVPTFISWPSQIPRETVSDEQIMNIDFLPTILEMAGIPLPRDREIDGQNIIPLLKGEEKQSPHEELFYIDGMKARAISTRDHYKYYGSYKSENSKYGALKAHPFLFNISQDRDESYDLRAHEPERAAAMRDKLAAFNREIQKNPRGWLNRKKEEEHV